MSPRLNPYRRKITQYFTTKLGGGTNATLHDLDTNSIKTILVLRPNHRLGNQLLLSPLLQEIETNFKHAKVDLFLKGNLGPVIFKNFPIIDKQILLPKDHIKFIISYLKCWVSIRSREYDLVINVIPNSSSGRLATKISKGRIKLYGGVDEKSNEGTYTSELHKAKIPISHLRNLLGKSLKSSFPKLKINLEKTELLKGEQILKDLFKNTKKTIALFTFATGNKRYSEDWWLLFYNSIHQKYGEQFNILEILPKENTSQIKFNATTFLSNDIREMASVIQNSAIFIGADCGVMHLACATTTPVLGLFSIPNTEKYQPYGNGNSSILTANVSMEDLLQSLENILTKDELFPALEKL